MTGKRPPGAPDGDAFGDRARREAALLLLAADSVIAEDHRDAGMALDWARKVARAVDTEVYWRDGAHCGDCKSQPHTCHRCLLEEYEAKAQAMWDEEGF